ncbi:putative Mg2+ transporter-C (MgtC) family protein [Bifidobacterium commune]|uniref:Putative Mg2+ transporter-C (MgtC) family protein n=1 Tax=Bifidobacterium commune TaxID=1505727 RepID=A0A1C4H355_9BIFI|nr:MgtC/SapB family protein [Bifidobacterium commune]MBB2955092.1 putative Mg2+ transporter-C (MgtC) family protein [Bifidobacterium commune]SCC79434.1 putative Mg2+ transporter-C (MgtC) family protein [Bifidobacterium commune]
METQLTMWAWQALYLFEALVLSTSIGMERQAKHKDAGTRTHALVGVGAALFVIIGEYGFMNVLSTNVKIDPSRIAAQIVSGISFIGAGIVFTQRSHVHGLTTAASIWMTAAIGTACGAGMFVPALVCTILYFIAVRLLPFLVRLVVPDFSSDDILRLQYRDGQGILRSILSVCTNHDISVEGFSTRKSDDMDNEPSQRGHIVSANLEIRGRDSKALISDLSSIDGVISVTRINNID